MFAAKNEFFTPSQGYQISRSVRLRSSASAYFNRTPGSTTNQTTWTYSAWIKRGALSTGEFISASDSTGGTNFDAIDVDSNTFRVYFNGTSSAFLVTTAVYRDPSAWYHLVVSVDTTQATASNRIKMYVNGVQVTSFSTSTYPSQNYATFFNLNGRKNTIGANAQTSPGQFFDGYLTEINFIDGQALTPTSFGQFNSVTGVWQPLKYTGTYGTNGFYLNFSDNSAATAAAIGKDYSGNGNNWTPNNISVTSGVTYDSMLDVPTPYADGGNGRGNYAVLASNAPGIGTISAANLQNTSGTTTVYSAISTISVDSGKWYWEVTVSAINSANQYPFIGAYRGIPNSLTGAVRPGGDVNGFSYRQNGVAFVDTTTFSSSWGAMANNDVIGVALDLTNLQVSFYKNNTLQGTITGLVAGTYTPADSEYNGSNVAYNFGQRPFTYTPPSGFVALNTNNLPAPTISNGALYMAATTYTGNGSTQTISNAVNGVSFQPDFVWYKNRSIVASHNLFDSVRGVNQYLISDSTAAEGTASGVTAFNSNGFSVGSLSNGNGNGNAIVGWQWQAGKGTTSSNTNGNRTSTVSVNATAGFSVVTYTFSTSATNTVGHGLGVAPAFIIMKDRTSAFNWDVYHQSVGYTQRLILNSTAAAGAGFWSAAPTSTVFSVTTSAYTNNDNIVAYCFSAVAGYSAFGSYTGNGSSDGPFVYLGFRPRWVLFKVSSAAGFDWLLYDSSRNTYNVTNLNLRPDLSDAEGSQTANNLDFLSNGFKIRGDSTGSINPAQTIIYAAFAENPFKLALAR